MYRNTSRGAGRPIKDDTESRFTTYFPMRSPACPPFSISDRTTLLHLVGQTASLRLVVELLGDEDAEVLAEGLGGIEVRLVLRGVLGLLLCSREVGGKA